MLKQEFTKFYDKILRFPNPLNSSDFHCFQFFYQLYAGGTIAPMLIIPGIVHRTPLSFVIAQLRQGPTNLSDTLTRVYLRSTEFSHFLMLGNQSKYQNKNQAGNNY